MEDILSIDDLKKRVLPSLKIKEKLLKKQGINIKYQFIWEYLALNTWKYSTNLTIADIVNDILNVDGALIEKYYKEM